MRHRSTPLPTGDHPAALEFLHFPTRQQAVVWRNWGLVPPQRLARVLRTSGANVLRLARGMGLPTKPAVEKRWLARGYCTLIRNNWHLLPYEQLLELLGWSAARLAFSLREEDALWVKLGCLKPAARPVRYAPLTPAEERRTAELRAAVRNHFGPREPAPADSPFAFLDRYGARGGPGPVEAGAFDLRLLYSYSAVYGDSLLHPELDPYPDRLLAQMAAAGANAVWLPAHLYLLNPWEPDPTLSRGWETRLRNLRRIARRIARRGLGLFLYLNEPRALPAASRTFKVRPEWRGVEYKAWGARNLCTSNQPVLEFVREGTARLFREAPDLAGVFTINMSEWPTHCHSHGRGAECPACAGRNPAELVAEITHAVAAGARSAQPRARIVVWNWAWDPAWAPEAVERLPEGCELMCTSEWGKPIRVGGVDYRVRDYSISQVGPSDFSLELWRQARRRGLKTVAKVQLNNSWELSAVPWLPVADLVASHLARLRRAGVTGLMLSWTVGGYPGGNLAFVDRSPDAVAAEAYGVRAAPLVRRAWTAFGRAFTSFPFSVAVIYNAPHNAGPMNLLWPKPTGYRSTMVQGFPYDDLKGWRDVYPEEVFEKQLRKLAAGWRRGLTLVALAGKRVTGQRRRNWEELDRMARAAYCHFRSAYLQVRFVRLRDGRLPRAKKRAAMLRILGEEIDLATTLYGLVRQDSRIGFEAANHYAYTANDLKEKVVRCEWLRRQ